MFIDTPYDTGGVFTHYDHCAEHMIGDRLEINKTPTALFSENAIHQG